MSKHSKWAKVKNQKAVTDKKRGQAFTKIARNITVAAREGGGDPSFNFKLRLAIDQAKAANMPKDNVERAIAKGVGGGEGGALKELVYEAFGPAGSAFIILAYSDNVNRTAADVKHILSKNSGSLAGQGAVIWQFQKLGVLRMAKDEKLKDKELELIDAGAEDIKYEDEGVTVFSKPENFQKVKEIIDGLSISIETAGIEYVAKSEVELSEEDESKADQLMEALDDYDDVSEVFTNIK
ncbi:MAG: YebC/PmpR family DNA-binding transcriptional regulator [Patescibacteria group bacterium]